MGTLSARFVQTITKPGRYGDGGGLYLQVSGTAAKSWIFIYRFKGRRPSFGLGSVSAVTLAQAREKTKDARRLLAERRDPIAERRSQELAGEIEIARQTTFRQITEDYIAIKDAESKHGDVGRMTRSQFRLHVFPLIGDLPVSAITLEVVLKVLRPIWHKRPNTANHIRMRMEHILTRSKVLGMRSGENPAQWRNNLDQILPAPNKIRPVVPRRALSVEQAPEFFACLRSIKQQKGYLPDEAPHYGATTLMFIALTAVRIGQVLKMRWPEVDFDTKTWVSPPENVKGKKGETRPHRIPLSKAAIALLKDLPRLDERVFPIKRESITHVIFKIFEDRYDTTVHGLRTTFKIWSRLNGWDDELSELALNHVVGSNVRRAYMRDDLIERRRALMESWSQYLTTPVEKNKVVPIKRRA
jgi:integrase